MTTLTPEELNAYLQKAAEKRAAQAAQDALADSEVGVLKEQKHVVHKVILESSKPISATPLNTASDMQGNLDTSSSPPSKKRQQAEDLEMSENPPATKKSKSDEGVILWSDTLAEFTGKGKHCKSLWDSRFPIGKFISEQILQEDDLSKIEAVGPEQAFNALQSYSLKVASVGRVLSQEFEKVRFQERSLRKELEAARKSLAEQPDLAKEVAHLRKKLNDQEDLTTEVNRLKKALDDKESSQKAKEEELKNVYDSTVKEWNEKYTKVQADLNSKSETLKEKDAEIEKLKIGAADYMITGFEKAKAQVRVLHPELDLSELSVLKNVRDGRIVENVVRRVDGSPKKDM